MKDGFLVALLVGFFGGLVNLLVDIPALWNYDWSRGVPSYHDLYRAPHRYLHTPFFCLLISCPIWVVFITFIYGLHLDPRIGDLSDSIKVLYVLEVVMFVWLTVLVLQFVRHDRGGS